MRYKNYVFVSSCPIILQLESFAIFLKREHINK